MIEIRPSVVGVDVVARLLGVHPHTVKRIPAWELPYFRLGARGDRRYRVADVELYIARRAAP
jgi:hypothetical protein